MNDWNSIYNERGILQKEASETVIEAVNFFKQELVRTVLDLGCGTGRHTAYLLKEGFQIYGCDSSETALELAMDALPTVNFETCNMTSLPYGNSFFDAVICNHVIQHGTIAEIKAAISEIDRILRKGGLLFLVAVSTNHPKYLTGTEIEPNTRINTDSIDGNLPHHFFTENELRALFSTPFEIVNLVHFEAPSELDQNKEMAAWKMYAKRL
ncbi:Ubiquinone/menaquinone biosynthesis C-methylase UbiE [Methanophagales archaeon]|jgi:SAM-dependent methyltransferase|nr:Ubiquinone/menaquinone biosynthesis C-methylase UbiE [Methanophagales archaeon]